jgi:uncharacterized membrane protein YsdA (DUF1294 family)
MGKLPFPIIGVNFAASILTFLAYTIDKSAVQNSRWRTQESTLHLFGMVGGWPGVLLLQKALSHNSKKERFQIVFLATVIINCFTLGWLLTKSGSAFLNTILDFSGATIRTVCWTSPVVV